MKNTRIILGGIAATLVLSLSACGFGPDESREDAKDVGHVDKTPPEVITFNNHYPNVETKCDGHGHRLYVTTHDSAVGRNVLIISDANCPGGVKGDTATSSAG
jgi:hypothetical protein